MIKRWGHVLDVPTTPTTINVYMHSYISTQILLYTYNTIWCVPKRKELEIEIQQKSQYLISKRVIRKSNGRQGEALGKSNCHSA